MSHPLEAYQMPGHTFGEDPYLDFLLAEAAWDVASTSDVDGTEKQCYKLLLLAAKGIITKVCKTCKTSKPDHEFIRKATHGQCKECYAAYQRNRKVYEPITEGSKHCNRCNETKPVAGFGRNKRSKDGLHSYCKPCAYAQVRASQKRNK